jgi:hypothetical protein
MSPRLMKGVGRALNPLDGDRIIIELGVRADKIAYVAATDIRVGMVTVIGQATQTVTFDVQITLLAEAIVEARGLQKTG